MASERDQYIERLKAKAERERQNKTFAATGSASARRATGAPKDGDRPSAPSSRKPTARRTAAGGPAGKNGRQAVAPNGEATAVPKTQPNEPQGEAHIWLSLGLIFVSLYTTMCVVSYFIYWEADEYLAYFSYLFDMRVTGAMNWGGKLGAILGNALVGRSFGVAGFGVAVVLMIWAIKVLRIKTLPLRKATRTAVTLMLLTSVALGQFAGYDPDVFGSGYGGELGIYTAEWLQAALGYEGTSLLLVVGGLALLYFINHGWLRKLVRWVNERREHNRLQQAARTMAQRRHDEQLREQLAAEAARLSEAAASAAAAMPRPAPQPEPQAEEPQEEQPAPPQAAPEPEPLPEPLPEPEPEKTEPPRVDPTRLIELEGNQWGYVFDWEAASGEPIYCYFNGAEWRAAQAVESAAAAAGAFVAHPPAPEPIEDDAEGEIEFVVKEGVDLEPEPQIEAEPEIEVPAQAVAAAAVAVAEPKKVHFAPAPDDPNFIVEKAEGDEQLDDQTINLTELYDPTRELGSYKKPPVELMHDHTRKVSVSEEELVENKNRIVNTLETFGIRISTIEATIGPTVTLYEIIPAPGVRISKIKNLEDDIALSLSALGIRIIAPIPGRGTIGIEVPNKDKETVSMYSVVKSAKFQESKAELPVALGKTIQNETFVLDLAKMPHLLVAGATGQGKSVGLNAILTSLLYKKHPSEIKFILVDPKKVELTLYAKLEKHFLAKMPGEDEAIITDTQKVIYTLNSICVEMDARYDLLKAAKVRNIAEYNEKFTHRRLNPEKGHRFLPYFVVIIDEFADLIMTAGREIETPIARIAQLARAVGIHLIIATQRPTTNIITGVIKANFPARIAFRVTSMIDSRTILDSPGANQLVGRGDMLVSTGSEVTRVQCAFIDTPEVDAITEYIASQRGYTGAYELPEYTPPDSGEGGALSREADPGKRDPLFDEVARFVVGNQSGSASVIQRRFSIGFNRAGRLIDQLEAAGIVGKADGSKPRQVLVQDLISLEMLLDA